MRTVCNFAPAPAYYRAQRRSVPQGHPHCRSGVSGARKYHDLDDVQRTKSLKGTSAPPNSCLGRVSWLLAPLLHS